MRNRQLWTAVLMLILGMAFSAQAEVTTTRDDKGVWFINGADSDSFYDVFEAMGYAVASDRLWQAELFRRTAKGTLAEIFGPDYLDQDALVRMTGYTDAELTAGFAALDAETREMVEGYVAGFNRRISEVSADPTQLPFEFHAIAAKLGLPILVPAPWTPEDVMAWQAMMLRNFDPEAQKQGQLKNAALLQYLTAVYGQTQGMAMFNDLRWTSDPAATTYIVAAENLTGAQGTPATNEPPEVLPGSLPEANLLKAAEELERRWEDRREKLERINAYVSMGSYAWVISGKKTVTGRPILYSGPQMGFDVPAIICEGSIEAAGLSISGMAIAGLPGIVIGRTPHHAWSMQVGHARTTDYYFEPAPASVPAGYYTSRQETIPVAGVGAVPLTVYRSPHGPVVSPANFDPATYDAVADGPIVAWRYSH
ncbi:MAG: penicillin acylase family protein, partial [Desulfococcus multivorans]|nr:penicillin acylase family protein [Desulfococcus multivorans]